MFLGSDPDHLHTHMVTEVHIIIMVTEVHFIIMVTEVHFIIMVTGVHFIFQYLYNSTCLLCLQVLSPLSFVKPCSKLSQERLLTTLKW